MPVSFGKICNDDQHLPSGKHGKQPHNELERSTILNGKINYQWPFSIAMWNYRRVWVVWDFGVPYANVQGPTYIVDLPSVRIFAEKQNPVFTRSAPAHATSANLETMAGRQLANCSVVLPSICFRAGNRTCEGRAARRKAQKNDGKNMDALW